jgi:predicted AlkP superfamily pyrophosphatase or phosphodiesterase
MVREERKLRSDHCESFTSLLRLGDGTAFAPSGCNIRTARSIPMRYTKLLFLSAALIASVPALASPVLLISIDGLPPRYVTEASRYKVKIPHLRSFVELGAHASGVIGVTPTVTYPNHTTIVTGVLPAQHGIITNTTFDPLNANREGWFWYAEDIRVPTLWTAAAAAKLKTASVNWPVTVGETHIDYLLPEYWRTSTPDDQKLMRALARPEGYLAQLEKKAGPFVDGNTDTLESDVVRTRFALAILRGQKPDFMAVHLVALDGTQHREGPETQAAFQVLEQIDAMVGELTAAVRANDPSATVAVVSDHGFIATHTAVNLRTRFVDAGMITLSPNDSPSITSWEAQVWPGGASAGIVLRDPKNAAQRQGVKKLLDELAADPRNGIARVLDGDELGRAGAFPGASFAVEFAPGFYLGAALQGDLLTPGTSRGTHGYLPQRAEMHASFFIQGPGVQAGRNLGVVDMRQVAPTLASILGVKLPAATQAALPLTSPSR